MRFSLRLNNDLPVKEYIRLAQIAEEVGFEQVWVSNDLFLRSVQAILPAIAGATKYIQIGSGILNPYTINPAEIATFAATMDEVSDCRFNLGLAAGAADFLKWVGIPQDYPLAAMRQTITTIRDLLAGERIPPTGQFLNWQEEAYLRFAAPRVTPIYLGAMGPNMLGLAGELADGVLPLLFPPEYYFEVQTYIDEGLQRRSAALGALDFAACLWVSIADEPEAARRALAEKIAYYGHAINPLILQRLNLTTSDFSDIEQAVMTENNIDKACDLVDDRMLKIGVAGQSEVLIARLEPLVAGGVTHLSFGPPLGPDPQKSLELLGRYVLPYFQTDAVLDDVPLDLVADCVPL